MKSLKKLAAILCVSLSITMVTPTNLINPISTVEAHSGRTDSSGGHKDNKNKSGLGSYHYHCGGHPAHLHENGVCPYANSSTTTSPSSSTNTTSSYNSSTTSKYNYSYSGKYKNASTEFSKRVTNGQFSQTIINQMPNYQNMTTNLLSQDELEDYTYLKNSKDIDEMSKLVFIRIYDYVLSLQTPVSSNNNVIVSSACDNAIFSAQYYMSNNPDLVSVLGNDAKVLYNHFMQSGMSEGRQGCASFNVNAYIANNPDLQQVFGNDLKAYYQHYLNYGQYEGRICR